MSAPLLDRRPAPRGPRAQPSDFGSGAGTGALGQALGDVADVGARILDNAERSRARRAATDAFVRMRERAAEIALEPDAATHEKLWEDAEKDLRDEHGEGLAPGYRDLYDEDLNDASARIGLEVRSGARKLLLDEARANDDYTLGELANEAARARDPGEAAAVNAKAAQLLGQARARGQWDTADVDKRAKAYEKSVADAALARLADNPEATRAALEARSGPFATMAEPDRQAAILQAQRRVETLARAARAEGRRAEADLRRAQLERKRAAQVELATMGRPGGPGVTVEAVLERVDSLEGEADYWFGVAGKGGFVVDPEALTPTRRAAITREAARLEALTPAALAEEPLDAAKLGPELDKWQRRQQDVREYQGATADSFSSKLNARVTLGRSDDLDPLWGADPLLGHDAEAEAFRQEAISRRARWMEANKRPPTDPEQDELLDQVILDWAARRQAEGYDITTGSNLGINPRGRAPRAPEAVPAELPAGTRPHATRAGVWVLPDGRLVERAP